MLATTLRSSFPVLLIITSHVLIAQVKYSRVKIEIPGSGMETLLKLDLDLDHGEYNKAEKTFISVLHASDLQKLRESGIRFSILVDDEVANFRQTYINEQQDPRMLMQSGKLHYENSCQSHLSNISVPAGFTSGSYGGYYSFAEMQARIDSLVNHYPAIVQKTILPQTTAGGRPMIVVKISDNVLINENEPEALYTGLHHAREGMSMMN
ncbi:MAG TPA: M14 family zinc carboxypeptidase, partial [Flavitalea sp.]|nr:M14 family zinc carboxypeptidase [Flavitalea sp.]